jgi:hypothetical protein
MFQPPQALSAYKWIQQKGIQSNLSRKCNRLFLDIHAYLSYNSLSIRECKDVRDHIDFQSVKVWTKKKGKIPMVPIFVRPDVKRIASHFEVSEQIIRLYFQGWIDSGFIIRTEKDPVPRPKAAYLILGGWNEWKYIDEDTGEEVESFSAHYLINEYKPGIKEALRTWRKPNQWKSEKL